ncbi:MAG: hypothetical protein ABIK28_00105 [Planctomycetota bacterium]
MQAEHYVEKVKTDIDPHPVLTGHSLGGAIAQYVGVREDIAKWRTFDSAEVGRRYLTLIGIDTTHSPDRHNIRIEGEALEKVPGLTKSYGTDVWFGPGDVDLSGLNSFQKHEIQVPLKPRKSSVPPAHSKNDNKTGESGQKEYVKKLEPLQGLNKTPKHNENASGKTTVEYKLKKSGEKGHVSKKKKKKKKPSKGQQKFKKKLNATTKEVAQEKESLQNKVGEKWEKGKEKVKTQVQKKTGKNSEEVVETKGKEFPEPGKPLSEYLKISNLKELNTKDGYRGLFCDVKNASNHQMKRAQIEYKYYGANDEVLFTDPKWIEDLDSGDTQQVGIHKKDIAGLDRWGVAVSSISFGDPSNNCDNDALPGIYYSCAGAGEEQHSEAFLKKKKDEKKKKKKKQKLSGPFKW